MNVTFTCRHGRWRSERKEPESAPSYEAFGRVVIDANGEACPGRQGIVTHPVAVGRPVLVDLCARDCLVEMKSSSRYVVVDEGWRKREHLPIVSWLHEQQIHVLTEVEPIHIEEAKERLRESYYEEDGETLLDPRFVGSSSPANMAEEGLYCFPDGIGCAYYYFGSCSRWPEPWDWRNLPQTYHQGARRRAPCIQLREYHLPVLASEAGENITGATFRMVMPGGVAGHPPVGCNRAILVVPKDYELPVLDDHEWQQKLKLAHAHQVGLSVCSRINEGHVGGPDFADKIRQVIRAEHFDHQLLLAGEQIGRFITGLKQFARQLTDEADKRAIATDINKLIKALDITAVEAEVDTVIARITDFEKTGAVIKRLSCLPESVGNSGVAAMLKVVEEGFDELDKRYSNHYFDNPFFDQIVGTGDISGVFERYQQHIYGNTSEAKEEMSVARVELTSSLVAVHEKIRELLSVYLQACRVPAVTGPAREALVSPLFTSAVRVDGSGLR